MKDKNNYLKREQKKQSKKENERINKINSNTF